MNIAEKTVLVTGANRGIGQALVNEALRWGRKGFMRARSTLQNIDERVIPLTLDVTGDSLVQRAVNDVESLDVLINTPASLSMTF